jgi:hypothetical protein
VVITAWKGEYFNNISLSPPPVLVRNDESIDFSFPAGAPPAPNMPSENWSARWTRTVNFKEGDYRFHVIVDDGARLRVGNDLLIDAWHDGSAREYAENLYLKGDVAIELDYYNHLGEARIELSWEKVTTFPDWKGSYFANRDLSGLPVFERNDPTIDFNWGSGSPRADIPADNFSVRWTRRLDLTPAGTYRFQTVSDDGVRLWIDGNLVIDGWVDGYAVRDADVQLSAGEHHLRLEYYEHLGGASIQLTWIYVAPTNTPVPPRAKPTNTPVPPRARPTDTPLPPRARPTNTPVPVPGAFEPVLRLVPQEGHLGQGFEVRGHKWPPNSQVDVYLLHPVPQPALAAPIAQPITDDRGAFRVEMSISKGNGWEAMADGLIQAQDTSGKYVVRAQFHILPDLRHISFTPIPANEQRFALPVPTYLVIESQEAWNQQFGSEPPPAEVHWKREIVVGAFLGPEAAGIQVSVSSIVQRGHTVSVLLASSVDQGRSAPAGQVPRVLVRVPRSDINLDYKGPAPELDYAFLNDKAEILAQGPAGNVQPVGSVTAFQEKALPLPGVQGTVEPEIAAPGAEMPEGAAPSIEATAEVAAPAIEAPVEQAPGQPPAKRLAGWILLGFWLAVVAAFVVAVIVVTVVYRRNRGRQTPGDTHKEGGD